MSKKPSITVTDMFCGAGGSTTGAVYAGAQVQLAINHWNIAIETHNSNYPNTTHVLTDISRADPRRFPSTTMLIASPECTNHSLAKGRRRRGFAQLPLDNFGEKGYDPSEERSRCTMWDPLRWTECHGYEVVILENVVDARLWVMWDAWLHDVYRCPLCADEVTPYYYAAANAIDWSRPIQRIGDRTSPLKEKTLKRIAYGLEKFRALREPLSTQTTREDVALVLPFIAELHGMSTARSVTEALMTVRAGGLHHGLVVPAWLMTYYRNGQLAPVTKAAPTVTTLARHALVTPGEQGGGEIRIEDCGFRMLEWEEIRAAMAFPSDYIITGNCRQKIKQLGNAVTPPVMELLVRRGIASLEEVPS
jgi:site-specific DNA-cytosine methylase